MQEGGLYKFCVGACIFMILISLSMNFVSILNVFGTPMSSPIVNQSIQNATTVNGNNIMDVLGTNMAGLITGSVFATAGLIIAVIAAGRTGSWNIVGAYLFGIIFWGSWISNISIFNYGGYSSSAGMMALYLMITAGMAFIFIGAVIGMLGGND